MQRFAGVRVLAPDDKPVAGARLWVTRNLRGFEEKPLTAKTDANGAALFNLQPQSISSKFYGSVTILASGGAIDGGTLKSGDNDFRLGATRTVSGRVVDEKGAPLSGVQLQLNASPIGGQGPTLSREMTAVSGADGRYSVQMVAVFRPYQITAQRDGYAVLSAPDSSKFNKEGNVWNAADIVMAKRDAALLVRVLAPDGKPVAGALVMAGKGDLVTAETGADGTAQLADLSAGETLVTAVFGNASGSATATANAAAKPSEVALTLRSGAPPAPRDVKRAYDILARALEAGKGKGRFVNDADLMQPFDADLAAKLRDKTAPPVYNAAALWAETLGNPDPESVLPRVEEFIERAEEREKKVMRAFFELVEGLQIVESDWPRAAQLLQSAETALRSMSVADRAQAMSDTVIACSLAGALATRLEKPSAQGWFDFAMILIDTEYPREPGQQDGARQWVLQGALRAGPKMLDYVASQFPSGVGASALASEIEKPRTDTKTALALLDKMEVLPDEKPRVDGRYREDKKSLFGRAVIALLPRLAKDDPAAALSLARRVQTEQHKGLALALAAQAQSGEASLKLLREAYDTQSSRQSTTRARIAAMIYDLDAPAGKPLFEALRRVLEAQQKQQQMAGSYYDWSTAEVTFYLARADVDAAHRLLEIGFARSRAGEQSRNSWSLQTFVMAMTPLDLDRALEMSLLLDDNYYPMMQRRLAEYVLASQAQRRALSFEDWQRGQWQPRPDVP